MKTHAGDVYVVTRAVGMYGIDKRHPFRNVLCSPGDILVCVDVKFSIHTKKHSVATLCSVHGLGECGFDSNSTLDASSWGDYLTLISSNGGSENG